MTDKKELPDTLSECYLGVKWHTGHSEYIFYPHQYFEERKILDTVQCSAGVFTAKNVYVQPCKGIYGIGVQKERAEYSFHDYLKAKLEYKIRIVEFKKILGDK